MFFGSIVALVTPFHPGGMSIDTAALKKLIDWHISEGTQGLLLGGTTGESLLLTDDEKNFLITTALNHSAERIPIFGAIATASTAQAVVDAKKLERLGVDGLVVLAPYYVRPDQQGIIEFFTAVHNATTCPIMLYNNPIRCGVNIAPETIIHLGSLPRLAGYKESANNTDIATIRHQLPAHIKIFCGTDSIVMDHFSAGADGIVSAFGNIAPRLARLLVDAHHKTGIDDHHFAPTWHQISTIIDGYDVATNPVPIKYALSRMGMIAPDVRSPLTPLTPHNAQRVDKMLHTCGLLDDYPMQRIAHG